VFVHKRCSSTRRTVLDALGETVYPFWPPFGAAVALDGLPQLGPPNSPERVTG
jgi:hypothetical protein